MPPSPDTTPQDRLAASWITNAAAWTHVVQSGGIPSRKAGTDGAILAAVARLPRGRVLDVGCGEGWLTRALAAAGHEAVGVDASAPLIDAARAASIAQDREGAPRYAVASYVELAGAAERLGGPFDAAVCNFALLDDDLTTTLSALHALLSPKGTLLVQTVHPLTALAGAPYVDAWREETFAAFDETFPATMPWYYRTLGSWMRALLSGGFALEALEEPRADGQPLPLSLLITATRR
ncbi:MAG TPA: class I SAM-dependent methyltransferase [Gemmatimonadaceae bacterium]|nr:class I SAM-dependent methyltransferase [Gemmatimonadaceae bacterium]